ncbi:hypothetical protein FNJ88_02955 [Chryseobacterium sp. SNU WT5]|uniref:hypothetical protein n=1 Tax=Chryseobacterium sp. SNU WT5 TaxID=2594269 RepID=UPI00117E2868|nr:hypothetical protein [Chryseobacterium sp. SNU WT5]QDP84561.1 hypothetical protein FNJ88_02955 [Chryseobacterium sp. SNU WT5]
MDLYPSSSAFLILPRSGKASTVVSGKTPECKGREANFLGIVFSWIKHKTWGLIHEESYQSLQI